MNVRAVIQPSTVLSFSSLALVVAAQAQPIKLNVAYTSTTTNFSIAWVAKL
jgi:hypothetical protein